MQEDPGTLRAELAGSVNKPAHARTLLRLIGFHPSFDTPD